MLSKYTSFHAADGKYHTPGHGHWNLCACVDYVKRHALIEPVTVTRQVIDMSGHGRGGHDGRYIVENNSIRQEAKWSEFGKES